MPPFFRTLLQAIVGLTVVALVWELAAWLIDNTVRLPAMSTVLRKAMALAPSDDYLRHATDSGTALLLGLLPALVVGVLLGAMAGTLPAMRWLVGPIAVTLGGAPLIVLLPIFVAWWGLAMGMKAATIAIVTAFPVMNAVMAAAGAKRGLPRVPHGNVRGSAANTAAAILGGLRLGVGLGVSTLIVVELIAASHGVGYVILSAANVFDTVTLMAGIVLVVAPTLVVTTLLQAIEVQVGD